jgi:hypothetical protein
VLLRELLTYSQSIPLHLQLLQELRRHSHRAAIPYDPQAVPRTDERNDLVADNVVSQQSHVGRHIFPGVRWCGSGERVRGSGDGTQAQLADLLFQLDGSSAEVR